MTLTETTLTGTTLTGTYRSPAVATRIGELTRLRTEFALPTRGLVVEVETEQPLPADLSGDIARYTDSLDLSFTSRGELVDTITALLWRNGIDDFLVAADGALRHRGATGAHVALRHPGDPDLAIGVATITDQALVALVDGAAATWVVAQEATTAADLCVALTDTTPHQLSRYVRFSYVRLFHDGGAQISRSFPGVLFSQH